MTLFLSPLEPRLDAALRDVRAVGVQARVAAAERLGKADAWEVEEAQEGLRTLLFDPVAQVRGAAVQSLALVARADDHQTLAGMLADSSPVVRELAVIALAAIDHPQRNAVLLGALDHTQPEVRFQALLACGELCPRAALDKLVALSRDEDARIRQAAARALTAAAIEEGPAQARLIALLSDAQASVAWAAALSLASHSHPLALPKLLHALEDPTRRLESMEALAGYRQPEAMAAVRDLARAALKPPLLLAAAGRTLLAAGQRDAAVHALRRALRALRRDGRNHALQTIATGCLVDLAEDLARLAHRPRGADPELLLEALSALAPGSQAALEGLRVLSQRPDETGRAAAALLPRLAPR